MPEGANEDWKRLADAVIARRHQLGISTRGQLAEATGLSYRLLGDIERGSRPVSEGTLALLEQALAWSPGSAHATATGGVPTATGNRPARPGAQRPARVEQPSGVDRAVLHALSDGFGLATELADTGDQQHGTRLVELLSVIGQALMSTPASRPVSRRDTATSSGGERSFHRSDPTVLGMALGEYLRQQRERRGLDHTQLCRILNCPNDFLPALEAGRAAFDEHLLRRLLDLYGVDDPAVIDECAALAAQSRQSGWWTRNNADLPPWFRSYVDHEQSADTIRTLNTTSVPELLQTEAYARAVLTMTHHGDIDRQVELRLERQHLLFRAGATRLWALVDETVLRRLPGTPEVQRDQIEHLILMARKRNVTLQVLPGHLAARNCSIPFTLLRFASCHVRRPDLVCIEDLTSTIYIDAGRDVEMYATLWSRLTVDALSPRDTLVFLQRLVDQPRPLEAVPRGA